MLGRQAPGTIILEHHFWNYDATSAVRGAGGMTHYVRLLDNVVAILFKVCGPAAIARAALGAHHERRGTGEPAKEAVITEPPNRLSLIHI